jgi:hypothetical protein
MHEHDWNRRVLLSEGGSREANDAEGGAPLEQATSVQHWALSPDQALAVGP